MPGGAAPAVTCAICARSLLVGERTERFSPDGLEYVDVCPLCREQALEAGWYREGGPGLHVRPPEPRRGVLARLFKAPSPPVMDAVAEPMLRRLSPEDQVVVQAASLFNGDFDGDLKSDVLWRNDNGAVYIWEMNGFGVKAEGPVAHAAVPNQWQIEGLGDFDHDGKGDVLWRNDSGQVYIWEMNGLQVKAEGTVAHAAVTSDWHVQSIADVDGDGKSDIIWRNDNGAVYIWEMNGLQIKAEGSVTHSAVGNDWHITA